MAGVKNVEVLAGVRSAVPDAFSRVRGKNL
jgi:hypothetical protein